MTRKCSLLILNYNGLELIRECLPSIIDANKYEGGVHEIILVDNASSDESCAYVTQEYPEITILRMPQNNYLFSYNEAIKKTKNDVVILLNNDVRLEKDFIGKLAAHFDDEKVFAVSAKLYSWDGTKVQSSRRIVDLSKYGLFSRYVDDVEESAYTFYAVGAASAFDKQKFLEMGGFDPLYEPYYDEDTDLSYNAWKRGWVVLYEPTAIGYHKEGASIQKYGTKSMTNMILRKNGFIFYWKNITDIKLILGHYILLPYRLVAALVRQEYQYFMGFIYAALKIWQIYRIKLKSQVKNRISDQFLIEKINSGKR